MFINKTILFVIISSFVVCGHIQTCDADDYFTLEKFIGVWYDMGIIALGYHTNNIFTCNWINVTKRDDGDQNFNEVYRAMKNGEPGEFEGYGSIVDSQIVITFPSFGDEESIYAIESYNNGEEMIIHKQHYTTYLVLMSRQPEVSVETKMKFDTIAADVGVNAIYFAHDDCPYIDY